MSREPRSDLNKALALLLRLKDFGEHFLARDETQRRVEALHKRDRDVRARTGPLYIRDAGEGEAIVLLHDFPLNSRMWEPQFEALRDRYRLIAPDLAGFGLTAAPPTELSLADHARDVLNVINTFGIERVTIAGLGTGGYVALHLVDELGARLQGLLLANNSISLDTPEVIRWRHELAAETELSGIEVVADEFLPKMLGSSTQRDHPEVLDLLRLMVRENSPSGVAGLLRAMAARPDSSAFLRRVHCPVVCVAGEEDTLTPPNETRLLAERVPGALTYTISEAGHLPNLETPDAFNDLLIQFMAESTPRSAPRTG